MLLIRLFGQSSKSENCLNSNDQWRLLYSYLPLYQCFAIFVPIFCPHRFSIKFLAECLHYQHYFEVIVRIFTQLLILNYFLLYYRSYPVSVRGQETRPTPGRASVPTSRTVQQQQSNNCIRENNVQYNVCLYDAGSRRFSRPRFNRKHSNYNKY